MIPIDESSDLEGSQDDQHNQRGQRQSVSSAGSSGWDRVSEFWKFWEWRKNRQVESDGTADRAAGLSRAGVPLQIIAPPPQTIQEAIRPRTGVAVVSNGLYLCGLGSFAYGAWLAWHPAGYLVGGLIGVGLGMLMDREESKRILDKFGRRSEE